MEGTLMIVVILLVVSLLVAINHIKELDERLTKETQHSLLLEDIIDNCIKEERK